MKYVTMFLDKKAMWSSTETTRITEISIIFEDLFKYLKEKKIAKDIKRHWLLLEDNENMLSLGRLSMMSP